VCTGNPEGAGNRPGSVGLPLPRTVIEIADLEEPDRLLGLNQRGEVCVRGPQVMSGYLDSPGETAETMRGGRLHTGDVGYLDADGYLYIVDRIKDLILVGGFNVYPRMVEEAIYLHPAVAEAAVVGVPDRHQGELVKAYVTLHPGHELTSKALRDFLRDKLATFELPRRVEIRETLPKTLIGKVSRSALRGEVARRDGPSAMADRRNPD
jgi:long-chain acyl-CoA synthetase